MRDRDQEREGVEMRDQRISMSNTTVNNGDWKNRTQGKGHSRGRLDILFRKTKKNKGGLQMRTRQ